MSPGVGVFTTVSRESKNARCSSEVTLVRNPWFLDTTGLFGSYPLLGRTPVCRTSCRRLDLRVGDENRVDEGKRRDRGAGLDDGGRSERVGEGRWRDRD